MHDFDLRSTYGTDQTHLSNPHKGVFAKKTIKECSPIVVRDLNPQCMTTRWCTPLGRVPLLLSCKAACHNVRVVKAFRKCHRVTWSSPMQALLINCGHVSMIRRLQNLLQPRKLHLWKIPIRRGMFVVMATTITDREARSLIMPTCTQWCISTYSNPDSKHYYYRNLCPCWTKSPSTHKLHLQEIVNKLYKMVLA